jgi:hypothetical protein
LPTDSVSRRAWYLIIGVVFAVHNAEEATAAPRMLEFMQFGAPIALRAFYDGVDVAELRFSLAILTLLGMALTAIAARLALGPRWAYVMLVFAAVIGLNALAHVVLSGIARTYIPGLATALLLTLPVAILVLVRARRDNWVSATAYWTAFPMALVIHGPVLVLFVRTIIGALRLLTGSAV